MQTIIKFLSFTLIMVSIKCSPINDSTKADLVILNATIWTGESVNPEARALAVKADTILAIGTNEEIKQLVGENTKMIDAEGKFVVPGFIDSHVHFLEGGANLMSVQLRDAKTKEEFINRIAAARSRDRRSGNSFAVKYLRESRNRERTQGQAFQNRTLSTFAVFRYSKDC